LLFHAHRKILYKTEPIVILNSGFCNKNGERGRIDLVSRRAVLLFTLLIGVCAFALVRTAASSGVATCHFESGDSYGAKKDTFYPGEDVYVYGSDFLPSQTLKIYIVNDKATWNDGDAIPSRIAGTATTVSSQPDGKILPTIVWHHDLTPGKYDIVIDVNGNGYYNKNIDCLDDNDLQVTAGFLIIPEYVLGTILGLAGFFAAFGAFRMFKSKEKANQPR
jgi:hypothetical protein